MPVHRPRSVATLIVSVALLHCLSTPVAAWGRRPCEPGLGRGWPAATQEYGSAVEHLLRARTPPLLRVTLLPQYGVESSLLLSPGKDGEDWTLRHVKADQRVLDWVDGQRELRVDQEVWASEVSMPAGLARRVVEHWQHALDTLAPPDRAPEILDGDQMTFVVDEMRVSGPWSRCGSGQGLHDQIKLLIKATEDDDARRARRWQQIEQSLDTLRQSLAGKAG